MRCLKEILKEEDPSNENATTIEKMKIGLMHKCIAVFCDSLGINTST